MLHSPQLFEGGMVSAGEVISAGSAFSDVCNVHCNKRAFVSLESRHYQAD
jgi:hypothetical protein